MATGTGKTYNTKNIACELLNEAIKQDKQVAHLGGT
jgi:type I site-specific restriction endonuclease